MSDTAEHTFGPSALATPANALTVARLLATPVFVGLIVSQGATWLTVAVGVLVAGSDGVGRLDRPPAGDHPFGSLPGPVGRQGGGPRGALFALAAEHHLPWAPVVLIAAREVGMSVYRSWAGRRGVSIPARASAKVKTLVQDLAIATCLVPPLADQHDLQLVTIWVAAALTLVTGLQYLFDGRGGRCDRRPQ